ncbi:MAG TPA: PKD domain-containing protein, partial [Chryseosolibacter sp.]|nr:PKD domain-containing protein [Chryseosolibacter sp.]
AAGYVSREVRGLPDDLDISTDPRKGWLYGSQGNTVNNFTASSDANCTDWASLDNAVKNDPEPDIFYVSASGLSASFIFDQNKNIRFLQQQNLKISYVRDATQKISSFTITNDNGVKYVFSTPESVTRQAVRYKQNNVTHFRREFGYYGTAVTFVGTWHITSINGVNNETLSFSYSDGDGEGVSYRYFSKVNSMFSGIDTLYTLADKSRAKILNSITSVYESATFSWINGMIAKIVVQDLDATNPKEYDFIYSEVRNPNESSTWGSSEYNKEIRSYLKEVVQVRSCRPLPSFRFEYHGVDLLNKTTTLPFRKHYPKDLFGYFNNATISNTNQALIPLVYRNTAGTTGERFRITARTGWTAMHQIVNRNVNGLTAYYGSLKKIHYPTGGFAEITYQAADYYDPFTNATVAGGGIRVSSVKIGTGDASKDMIRNYEYKQTSNLSSGRWTSMPQFAFEDGTNTILTPDNLAGDAELLYERVSVIIPGRGKTVYTYNLPAMYNTTAYNGTDWKATKSKVARYQEPVSPFYCEPQGTVVYDFYTYPYPPNTNYDFERGLLKQVEVINQANQTVSLTKYNYQRSGTLSRVKGIRHEQINSLNYVHGQYEMITGITNVLSSDTTILYDTVSTTKKLKTYSSYTYNTRGYPRESTTVNSDGVSHTSGNLYVADYTVTSGSGLQAKMLKKMTGLNLLTSPVEQYSKVNSNVIKSLLFLYDSMATNFCYVKEKLGYSGTGAFTLSSVSGSPQVFNYENTKYRNLETYEQYSSSGLPITVSDKNKNITSILYGRALIPAVIISNARVNESVFADFEFASSSMIGSPLNFINTDAWSGRASYNWNGAALTKTGITKGSGRYYRFSCWVKATTASNITINILATNGTSVSGQVVYPSSSSGQWKLLETTLDLNTLPSTFSFQMSTTATSVFLDDVSFYPQHADFVRTTVEPMVGTSSTSNSLNQYSFTDYDDLGRVLYERNTDKHILTSYDHKYKSETPQTPVSTYKCTSGCDLKAGQAVTFTAQNNCLSPVNYDWKVDGSSVGTNSTTLTYTFPSNKNYKVELTATSVNLNRASTTAAVWKIHPAAINMSLLVDNPGNVMQCTDTGERTFTARVNTGCIEEPVFQWQYKLTGGQWISDSDLDPDSNPSTYTFSFTRLGLQFQAFSVRCILTGWCTDYAVYQESPVTAIGFTAQSNCQ